MTPSDRGMWELFERARAVVADAAAERDDSAFGAGVSRLQTVRPGAVDHAGAGRPRLARLVVVDEWLEVAITGIDSCDPLGVVFAEVASDLRWRRSYEHLGPDPMLDGFRDHYAYAVVAGPADAEFAPPIELADVLLGFTLQAPGVRYPHHHHRPAELYGMLSGAVDWQVDVATATVGPGDIVAHRSNESHAMTTLSTPALTWVFWAEGLGADVWMPSMQPEAPGPTRYPDRGRAAFADDSGMP